MKKPKIVGQLLVMVFFFVCSASFAQDAPTTRKAGKEKLAILDLEAKYGIEREFAEGLSVIIRDEIHNFGKYEVMSREDLQAVASQEQMKQALGCDEGSTCLVDFGRAIGTRFIVVGSISKFGTTYTISLRVLDTKGESAGVVNRTSMKCKCAEEDMIITAQNVAAKLMGKETPEMLAEKQAAEKERLAAGKSKAEKADKEKQAALAEGRRKADETEKKKIAAEHARLNEDKADESTKVRAAIFPICQLLDTTRPIKGLNRDVLNSFTDVNKELDLFTLTHASIEIIRENSAYHLIDITNEIDKLGITDNIWLRKTIFSWLDPDIETICKLGEKINVGVVFMYQFRIGPGKDLMRLIMIDVKKRSMTDESLEYFNKDNGPKYGLMQLTKKIFKEFR